MTDLERIGVTPDHPLYAEFVSCIAAGSITVEQVAVIVSVFRPECQAEVLLVSAA